MFREHWQESVAFSAIDEEMRSLLFPYSYTVQSEKLTELIQMLETTSKTSHLLSQENQQKAKSEQTNFWELDSLYQANLFTIPQFLKPKFCIQLQAEVSQYPSQRAQVIGKDNQPRVNQTVRRTDKVQVSPHSWKTIKNHLIGLKPQLEQYFKTDLSEMEEPRALRYYQGDFFSWHADRNDNYPIVKDRKVTTIIYLNGSNEESELDSFIGGELEIYVHDLIPQEEYRKYCLQLSPKTGLLVALNSRIHHQVQPIVRGVRYVISTHWR